MAQAVAVGALAGHRVLEPRDDAAVAVQVVHRLAAGGGVEDVAVVVAQRVVEGDDVVGGDG